MCAFQEWDITEQDMNIISHFHTLNIIFYPLHVQYTGCIPHANITPEMQHLWYTYAVNAARLIYAITVWRSEWITHSTWISN